VDFTTSLTFPFEDDDWLKKIGLGVLIQFIPFVGQFTLQGWSFEIARRVRNNDAVPLPDWSDFGGLLSRGFMIFLGNLLYQIPLLIFACVAAAPWLVFQDEDMLPVAIILAVCCGCLAIIYGIVANLIFWAGYVRYIDNPEFGTFFQFGENIALFRENMGDFGMALVYFIVAGLIASVASTVTAGLGSLLATPFYSWFGGHLLGQLATMVSGESLAEDTAPAV